jgi:hypothetical protein
MGNEQQTSGVELAEWLSMFGLLPTGAFALYYLRLWLIRGDIRPLYVGFLFAVAAGLLVALLLFLVNKEKSSEPTGLNSLEAVGLSGALGLGALSLFAILTGMVFSVSHSISTSSWLVAIATYDYPRVLSYPIKVYSRVLSVWFGCDDQCSERASQLLYSGLGLEFVVLGIVIVPPKVAKWVSVPAPDSTASTGMSTVQLVVLWWGGFAVAGVLALGGQTASSIAAAISVMVGISVYTLGSHPRARKRMVLLLVAGPPLCLWILRVALVLLFNL